MLLGFFGRKDIDWCIKVCGHVIQFSSCVVINLRGNFLIVSNFPDPLVDKRRHLNKFRAFVLDNVGVGVGWISMVPPRATAVNIISIDRSILMEVIEVLFLYLPQNTICQGGPTWFRTKQCTHKIGCKLLVSLIRQMHPVKGVEGTVLRVEFLG